MTNDYAIVMTTLPDAVMAERLADALLEQRLAACVSCLPALVSHYEWQGQREHSTEVLVLVKTRTECYEAVEACIRGRHPYELPEIVMLPIMAGLPAYLGWIDAMTKAGT